MEQKKNSENKYLTLGQALIELCKKDWDKEVRKPLEERLSWQSDSNNAESNKTGEQNPTKSFQIIMKKYPGKKD